MHTAPIGGLQPPPPPAYMQQQYNYAPQPLNMQHAYGPGQNQGFNPYNPYPQNVKGDQYGLIPSSRNSQKSNDFGEDYSEFAGSKIDEKSRLGFIQKVRLKSNDLGLQYPRSIANFHCSVCYRNLFEPAVQTIRQDAHGLVLPDGDNQHRHLDYPGVFLEHRQKRPNQLHPSWRLHFQPKLYGVSAFR